MPNGFPRMAVVGIGNPDRGDDAVGRTTAKRLRDSVPDSVEIYDLDGEATSLIRLFENVAAVYVIDACRSGSPPGTIYRLDAGDAPLPERAFGVSTHGLGLSEAIELARSLGTLPPCCIVYAIEGATFVAGAPLSKEAENAADMVARSIQIEIIEALRAVCHA